MLLEDPDPLLKSYCRYIVIRKGTPRPFFVLLLFQDSSEYLSRERCFIHTHFKFYHHIPTTCTYHLCQ